MRLYELLNPGIVLHKELNPILWEKDDLKDDIRTKLLDIADKFIDYLNINREAVTDIILTGSNCAFTFTEFSDLDLHLIIDESVICADCPGDFIEDCFNAKKSNFNDNHHITVKGYVVELYAQPQDDRLVANGIYSLQEGKWLKHPEVTGTYIDADLIQLKTQDFITQINDLIDNQSDDLDNLEKLKAKLKRYRQSGLDKNGELGLENQVYKTLRNNGYFDKLYNYIGNLEDKKLSY